MPDIYISRSTEQLESILPKLEAAGLSAFCSSQIKREFVPFELPSRSFDWVFFSSPFAVDAFFNSVVRHPEVKWGAIGPGTAKALEDRVVVDFTGKASDTDQVAREFAELAGNAMVLFPSPEKGLRKVQTMFPSERSIELVCYKTSSDPSTVPGCKLYVFSSPSNVKAFFQVNEISADTPCIAFGPSTFQALKANGIQNITVLRGLEEDELLEAIFAKFVS